MHPLDDSPHLRTKSGIAVRAFSLLLICILFGPAPAQAAERETWLVVVDLWGNPVYQTLEMSASGGELSGDLDGGAIRGRREGDRIRFVATDSNGATASYDGRIGSTDIAGRADLPDPNDAKARAAHDFAARRIEARPPGPPRRHDYRPDSYSNEFSPHRKPVLTIWPKDTVHTSTLDSGGVDEHGKTRALFGNPQTGPFFVVGARPGDTLAIHMDKLRLNRDYADSLDSIVGRALGTGMAAQAKDLGRPVRWTLDRERGMAYPEKANGLKDFSVPLRPMLGGLAVAPGFGSAPISTGDTGRFGGNMDFNEVAEGRTIYLPVMQPGALLYLGDAHAAQGDGETSQYALETSMDVEFTVDVLPGKSISTPRVESPTQLMALGQAGSLDEALRAATAGLTQWLQQDYGLSLSECAQVLGSAVEYRVANLAGRSVGLAAMLDKSRLAGLKKKADAAKSG
ncbi:acetamidase [Luteimonas gilva]|uniref:Acetamidase n=1 Tax=Luteimonas gilva TaxID=2572684 RepID=A0A4U5JJD0_9GAMM|nr:acetamidase/formamidase family protein [Luteimonas gilva]TKR29454.1 acetamidase [Luteimonas gilva]